MKIKLAHQPVNANVYPHLRYGGWNEMMVKVVLYGWTGLDPTIGNVNRRTRKLITALHRIDACQGVEITRTQWGRCVTVYWRKGLRSGEAIEHDPKAWTLVRHSIGWYPIRTLRRWGVAGEDWIRHYTPR